MEVEETHTSLHPQEALDHAMLQRISSVLSTTTFVFTIEVQSVAMCVPTQRLNPRETMYSLKASNTLMISSRGKAFS